MSAMTTLAVHERQPHTLDHPLHFDLTRVKRTLDPAVLPCEELDELDLLKVGVSMNLCKFI